MQKAGSENRKPMAQDCIFCKIISGDIPSEKVYEDEKTLAFLDINPVQSGHTLVIPKEHFRNVFDITNTAWEEMMETVRKVAGGVKIATNADAVNIMLNNEPASGQLVYHAHAHVIPRFSGDGLKLWPQHPYPEGEAKKVGEKIREALDPLL